MASPLGESLGVPLDKQGRAGAFALQPGFNYAVTDTTGQTRIERAGALFA
jgi:N4-(beta-N-acetylglucosaminyl)-L-asparaginase